MRKSTWAALTVFAVLWVAAAWVLSRKPERGMSRISFAAIDANDTTRIEILGPNAVQLKKDGSVWRLANGREADGDAVRTLLSRTQGIQSSERLTQDSTRFGDFAVDAAHGTGVKLFGSRGPLADFTVGAPVNTATAVRVDDSVYKVAGALTPAFVRDANEWVERRLFLGAPDQASKLTVALAGEAPYSLVNKEDWQLLEDDETRNHDFRLDPVLAQALFSALLHSRAETIVDPDPGPAVTKLGSQAERLTWFARESSGNALAQDANAAKQVGRTLLLGASVDGKLQYAQVEGRQVVYTISNATATALRRKLTDLRDMRLMAAFQVAKVRSIAISDGKDRLIFSRDPNTSLWHTASRVPPGFALENGTVLGRIASVAHARAQMLTPDASKEHLVAKGAVQLTFDDKKVEELTFYGPTKDAGMVYARGTADGSFYGVATSLRDTLLAGLQSFRKQEHGDGLSHIDPKTLDSLPPEIRAGLEQQMAQKARQQQVLQGMRQARQP